MKHLEYNQIDDYIFIGTTICCQTHLDELLRLGISADVATEPKPNARSAKSHRDGTGDSA